MKKLLLLLVIIILVPASLWTAGFGLFMILGVYPDVNQLMPYELSMVGTSPNWPEIVARQRVLFGMGGLALGYFFLRYLQLLAIVDLATWLKNKDD